MQEFWIGIISSLSATVIGFFIAKSFRAPRKKLISLLGKLTDIDIENVYKNKREGEKDIMASIEKSSTIKIITGRGNELQRETFLHIFEKTNKVGSVKIVLPNPYISEGTDWLDAREKEVISFNNSFKENTLKDQVKVNIQYVKNIANKNTNMELKLSNAPHLGRFIILDDCLYYYFLKPNSHGRDSKMIKCKSNSETYQSIARYFDELWKYSINA